jgi:hypothetical protein
VALLQTFTKNGMEMKVDASRSALILEGSLAIGSRWTRDWCEEMLRTGRAMEGGWPGTLPEARMRVASYFRSELTKLRMAELNADELAAATRSTYEQAKREWLRVSRETMLQAKRQLSAVSGKDDKPP